MKRFPLPVVTVAACLISIALVIFTASAQNPCANCTPGPNNGSVANAQLSSWPPGTTVTVYIDPAFAQIQGGVQAIKTH